MSHHLPSLDVFRNVLSFNETTRQDLCEFAMPTPSVQVLPAFTLELLGSEELDTWLKKLEDPEPDDVGNIADYLNDALPDSFDEPVSLTMQKLHVGQHALLGSFSLLALPNNKESRVFAKLKLERRGIVDCITDYTEVPADENNLLTLARPWLNGISLARSKSREDLLGMQRRMTAAEYLLPEASLDAGTINDIPPGPR